MLSQLSYDDICERDLKQLGNRLQVTCGKQNFVYQVHLNEQGKPTFSQLAAELCENDHLQLVDPNNFVEPGMVISNTYLNPNIHKYKEFNFAGLKRDLRSTHFGNLVIY